MPTPIYPLKEQKRMNITHVILYSVIHTLPTRTVRLFSAANKIMTAEILRL